VFGYEALVRSGEPKLGNPGDLFDVAGRLGRLHDLGRRIRTKIAEASDRFPADGLIFVNVHPEELRDFDLYHAEAPLSRIARRVVLEVTERSTLGGIDGLRAKLSKLRALGFRIALDDLGAGYSGLSSFTLLEPDVVKIDMSLVRDIDTSSRKRSIVRSLLDLAARDLNALVICEGVETPGERDALLDLGADLLQGYLFGRPARDFASVDQLPGAARG
jgi:EAL domain-containing protein (putative c-di-GMP-specific phosphodiesterase class I)